MRAAAPLIGALLLAACTTAPPAPPATCPAGLSPQHEARLYFGLTTIDGARIADADWSDFVAGEITPRFPDGLTAYDTSGQWRDRSGSHIVRQPSRVIEIIVPDDAATFDRLQAIRDAYRARFHQQSVGLTLNALCAGF